MFGASLIQRPPSGGFRPLAEVVGLISSGLRADTAGRKIGMAERFQALVSGKGIESLEKTLSQKKIPVRAAHLEDDIYQTSDENRSIVELISNALDAGPGDVDVTLKDGFFEVSDHGRGMTPKIIATKLLIPKLSEKPETTEPIGRFGIGFLTVLRHLKNEGESVVVETKAMGCEAYRLTYQILDGKLQFKSEVIDSGWGKGETGTRVRVTASDIKKEAMIQEIDRYLRHVDPKRALRVNGEKVNNTELTLLQKSPFDEKQKAQLSWNSKGKQGILIKVGEVIVEHYASEGRNVAPGELVISLPQNHNLSITRDLIEVDEIVVTFFENLLSKITKIEHLNSLVSLFESLEKRNPPRSLMEILRKRSKELVEERIKGQPLIKIYPDQNTLSFSDEERKDLLRVHPSLFHGEWWQRFEVPAEFQSGTTVNGAGEGRPVRLVLSEEMQGAIHYDSDLGTIYLNKDIYQASPSFILSALFMIENLRFRVNWGERLVKGGMATSIQQSLPPRKLDEFLRSRGLTLSSVAQKFEWLGQYSYFESHVHNDRLVFLVLDPRSGFWGVIDEDRSILIPPEYGDDDPYIYSHGDRLMLKIDDSTSGYTNLIGENDENVLPFNKYWKIDVGQVGGRLILTMARNGFLWGCMYENQIFHLPYDYDSCSAHFHNNQLLFCICDDEFVGLLRADNSVLVSLNREYRALDVYSHNGELLFIVKNNLGQVGVLKEDKSVLLPFEYSKIEIHAYGDRLLFVAQDLRTELSGVLEGSETIILPFEYKSIFVYTDNDQLLFAVTDPQTNLTGILREDKSILLPFNYSFYPTIHTDDGRLLFDVQRPGTKYGLIGEDQSIVLPLEYESIESHTFHDHDLTFVLETKNSVEKIPYSLLRRIAEDQRLQERFDALRDMRLDLPSHLKALCEVSDQVWDRFFKNPYYRLYLHRLSHPGIAAYAELYLGEDFSRLTRAMDLIERFWKQKNSGEEELFLKKINHLVSSRMDVTRVLNDLKNGRTSHDIEAIRLYLTQPGSVLLPAGTPEIHTPSSKNRRLAEVITQIRLKEEKRIDKLKGISSCEQDERDLHHAIHHLNISNPFAFVRELLQNSLDLKASGRVVGGPVQIDVNTFESDGKLVLSFKDNGGMTEEELIGLLDPGEGTKRGKKGYRGGFGFGFYSTLAEANWVRIKTAVQGSDEILFAEFLVERDQQGKIKDIQIKTQKQKNREGFSGTLVETERHTALPAFEAARLEANFKDLGKYVGRGATSLKYNGEEVNRGDEKSLIAIDSDQLGRIELFDGLQNRLLLGGLPLTDLPKELWDEVPEGVKKYYSKLGFYLNLDHEKVQTTQTRDRFREPEKVLPELKKILPGLLIQGFLQRVADPSSSEDLYQLPEVYFIQVYELANARNLGWEILKDAERLNAGRYAEVDYEKYSRGEEGERNLLKLLTLIRFIPVKGESKPLSLKEIYEIYQGALSGNLEAQELLDRVLKSEDLPASIRSRLNYAERSERLKESEQVYLKENEKSFLKRETIFEEEEIKDEATRNYLKLLKEVTQILLRHHWKTGSVNVGIHTLEEHLGSYAFHYGSGETYHLYRSFGKGLEVDVQQLKDIHENPDRKQARKDYEGFLASLFEVISHELTHLLTERPDRPGFPHDPKFFQDQMKILMAPQLAKDLADRWWTQMRGDLTSGGPPKNSNDLPL